MPFRLPLLAALAALALVACSGRPEPTTARNDVARIARSGVIRIGVKADTPPFGSRVGGQLVGFDIDLAHLIARKVGGPGVEITWVPVTSGDRIDRLLAGEVDLVIASMTITRRRDALVDFSIPYFEDGQSLLVKGDGIASYRDLAGKKVGATRGSTSGANIAVVAPSATLVEYDGFEALVAALEAGEIDAATSDRLILKGLATQAGPEAGLNVVGGVFTTEPYGVALRQNQSLLRDRVNAAIQEAWEEGLYHEIFDTWLGCGTIYDMETYTITPFPR